MKNIFSDEKIIDFRDLVNSNSNFVYNSYSNKNGKNLWNLICSCMDWLTVSIRHLQNAPILDENIDVRVMQMFSLISSIDLVSESITQLHRVFINPKTLPFEGERLCFSERIFDEDDNSYFKSIRASFGAHPVNLNPNQTSSKRFASWPFNSHTNSGLLTVHLYSNKVNEEDLIMCLRSNELIEFLTLRYNYLDVISEKIKAEFNDFTNSLAKQHIENKSDSLEQLYLLRIESKKRLDNDYYNGVIDELIMIFEAEELQTEHKTVATDYKRSLEILILEIKNNLQTMRIEYLENTILLNPSSDISRELRYELGKFYTWIHSDKHDPLITYYLERFNQQTGFKFNFSTKDSIHSLLLKVKLMLKD